MKKVPETFRPGKDLEEKTKRLVEGAEKIESEDNFFMYIGELTEKLEHYMKCRKEKDEKYVIIIKDSHYSSERFGEIGQEVISLLFKLNDGKRPDFNLKNDSYPELSLSIKELYIMLHNSENTDAFQVIYTYEHGLSSMIRDKRLEKFIEKSYIIEI